MTVWECCRHALEKGCLVFYVVVFPSSSLVSSLQFLSPFARCGTEYRSNALFFLAGIYSLRKLVLTRASPIYTAFCLFFVLRQQSSFNEKWNFSSKFGIVSLILLSNQFIMCHSYDIMNLKESAFCQADKSSPFPNITGSQYSWNFSLNESHIQFPRSVHRPTSVCAHSSWQNFRIGKHHPLSSVNMT